jgi:hypothetical protein
MAKKTGKDKFVIPPHPNAENYILVTTKEGTFWRRKRGSVKPAPVNAVLARNAEASKITGPAAKRVVDKLRPFLRGLQTGRLTVRIIGALRKALNQNGRIDFTFLEGMELQPEHHLDRLLVSPYKVEQTDHSVQITIPIEKGGVKKHNNIVSDYYFDAIVVQGDATKDNGLRLESAESQVYHFGEEGKLCTLSIDFPAQKEPWMLLLKVSCIEGNELAVHPKHYGMKVVKVGI